MRRPSARAAAVIAALAFLRMAAIVAVGSPFDTPSWPGAVLITDHESYMQLASDLMDGVQDSPAYRTPGYPLYMLLTMDLLPAPWLATVLLQQLADALVAAMCFLASRRVSGDLPALAASSLYMLLPSGLIWTSRVAPDVWAGLFACASGSAWLAAVRSPSPRARVALGLSTGLCLSLGSFVKPVFAPAPLVYAVAAAATPRIRFHWKVALVACVALAAAPGPILQRQANSNRFGLDALTTQDSFEPMGRTLVSTGYLGFVDDGSVFLFRDSLEHLFTVCGRLDYAKRDSVFRRLTLEAVRYDPMGLAIEELTRWPKFFVNLAGNVSYIGLTPEDRKPLGWALATSVVQSMLLLAAIAAPFLRRTRRTAGPELALAASWAAFTALACGPIASFRYGLLFYWSLVPLAAMLLSRHRSGQGTGAEDP